MSTSTEPAPAPRMLRTAMFALTLVAALYAVDLVSHRPILEKSEARYVEIAREMYASGDYIVPRLHGIAHFDKPPVAYWMAAAGYHVLGVNAAGARLLLVFAGIAFVAFSVPGVRLLFAPGHRPLGWLAVGMTATMPLVVVMAHLLTTDMFVSLLMNASLLMFYWGDAEHAVRRRVRWALWVVWGAALMTKGPVGVVIPWLIIAVFLWREGRLRDMRWVFHIGGLVAMVAMVLPWFLAVALPRPGLAQYFLGFQILDRVVTTAHHRSGSPLYYIPVVLGGAFPWVFCLPAAWRRYRAQRRTIDDAPERLRGKRFLWVWTVAPFVAFSLIGSKLPAYILLIMLPLALLAAEWAHHAWTTKGVDGSADEGVGGRHWTARLPRFAMLGMLGAVLAGGVGCFVLPVLVTVEGIPDVGALIIWLVPCAALGLCVFLWFHRAPGVRNAAAAYFVPLGILGVAAWVGLVKIAPQMLSVRPLAEVARARRAPGEAIASFKSHPAGWDFYLEEPSRLLMVGRSTKFALDKSHRPLQGPKRIRRMFAEHPAWVILKRKHLDALREFAPRIHVVATGYKYMVVHSEPIATP